MAGFPQVPVFLRVGDSPEQQIGSFTPDVTTKPSRDVRSVTVSLDWRRPLAELLREAADSLDAPDPDQPLPLDVT